MNSHAESSSSGQGYGSLGPDDAPRTRTSTVGQQYYMAPEEMPPLPTQQPLFAQHSGSSAQTQSMHSGSSNPRPVSRSQAGQAPPLPSMLHGPMPTHPQPQPATTARPGTASKSPFTTPITCPPRNRPNQVLLINPSSTTALTNLMLNTLRPILPHALEVTAYSAPYPAPTAVESAVDNILSSETVIRDLAKYSTNNGETIQNYDAMLIASFGKHPLIDALRESYDVPVIGILEASLYVARMLGGRFGVLSISSRTKVQIDDAVSSYGLSQYFIGVESLHISPLELLNVSALSPESMSQPTTPTTSSRSREDLQKRMIVQSRALVAKGADTIILGSEFLSSNEAIRVVKDAIRDEDGRRTVNVVDAVEAGIMMLNGLVGMGVPTSKKGLFRGEREARRGRGQTWL